MKMGVGGFAGAALAVVVGGLLALSSPALAQPAAPAAAQAAQPDDPERLALARQLFTTMHLDATMRGVFATMFKSIADRSADGPAAEKTHQLLESFSVGFEAGFPDLIDAMARLYARNLTTHELRDSLTFYQSPSGQAILGKMPAMMRDAMPLSLRIMPKIAAAAENDYCARHACVDADRAVFRRLEAMGSRGAASR